MKHDAMLTGRRRLLAALGLAAMGASCGRVRPPGVRFGGETMGSTFTVRLARVDPSDALADAARAAVVGAFDDVVARMSTFDTASEIGRFNRFASTAPFALSRPVIEVLAQAAQVARQSGGAFDVTVAPLVRAWGFGAGAAGRSGAPDAQALAAAPIGWPGLALDEAAGQARKAVPGLQLDLSGIAKGYAVDRAAQALEALGFEHYLVEAGGEVRTRGHNHDGEPWRIGIERPDAWPQQAYRVVGLQGHSMATSGDYRNFYELAGRRVHHEIDPATRAPAAHGVASVSVLHAQCMVADAWATALFVLGAERGLVLARERGLAALFIERGTGGALVERMTPAFAAVAG